MLKGRVSGAAVVCALDDKLPQRGTAKQKLRQRGTAKQKLHPKGADGTVNYQAWGARERHP